MAKLIQSVNGQILDNIGDSIDVFSSVDSFFGYEQWFKVTYLEVFLQNFKNVIDMDDLNKNRDLGLNINRNKSFDEIEISY